jgi:hypothetical protein
VRRASVLALLLLGGACGKSPDASTAGASGSATPSSNPSASSAQAPPPAQVPTAAASASRPSTWRGTYRSAAGTLYIPPEWKNVRWTGAETSAGIGEGAVTLTVDPASGRVQGTVDGPLGPATVDGVAQDGKVAATIRRRDPGDRGFTGTLEGSLSGDHGEGTMSLSLAEASALRSATFTLAPADGTPAVGAAR